MHYLRHPLLVSLITVSYFFSLLYSSYKHLEKLKLTAAKEFISELNPESLTKKYLSIMEKFADQAKKRFQNILSPQNQFYTENKDKVKLIFHKIKPNNYSNRLIGTIENLTVSTITNLKFSLSFYDKKGELIDVQSPGAYNLSIINGQKNNFAVQMNGQGKDFVYDKYTVDIISFSPLK